MENCCFHYQICSFYLVILIEYLASTVIVVSSSLLSLQETRYLFLYYDMHTRTIATSKNNIIFTPFIIRQWKSWTSIKFNIITTISTFIWITFLVLNTCLNLMIMYLIHKNEFTTFPQVEDILSCMKQFSLNFALILLLWIKRLFWGRAIAKCSWSFESLS